MGKKILKKSDFSVEKYLPDPYDKTGSVPGIPFHTKRWPGWRMQAKAADERPPEYHSAAYIESKYRQQ